ncbi:hypothetical protein ACTI_74780 [Actinoplanes sp. OR16]|uniref:hypothetical protein n=1 Tax=Actinoplanes sp. OR16 TaxID=946334 RepID=UPI000F71812D|nr:hypothetical protein [Actinoplanes sp. OR16]BBH70793.1 hypothetical protein ACTI_74780 [Actinoplanes sp. OR16]
MTIERHYRLLLLAHSGPYRRRHGTEIVTTLMEMADPGRRRPSAAESWDLIAGGLRQRFRLPRRPLVLLTAVLVMVATGVLGAAAGSWAGGRTFAPLPGQAEVQRLLGPGLGQDMPLRRMSTSDHADEYLLLSTPTARRPGADPERIATAVRDRITAAGWTVTSFAVAPAYENPENAEPGTHFTAAHLQATRDGVIVHGRVDYQYADGQLYLGGFSATMFAQRTAAYLPLTIAGGILGLLAGWLLAAAGAYRLRSSSPGRRRTVAVLTGAALVLAVAPVFAVVRQAIELAIHLGDTRFPVFVLHAAVRAGSSADGQPTWLIPACTVAAVAFGALAFLRVPSSYGGPPRSTPAHSARSVPQP